MEELIRKIELILIKEGQHDKRFKLGEYIKYAPYEVSEILRKHIDELVTKDPKNHMTVLADGGMK